MFICCEMDAIHGNLELCIVVKDLQDVGRTRFEAHETINSILCSPFTLDERIHYNGIVLESNIKMKRNILVAQFLVDSSIGGQVDIASDGDDKLWINT